MSEPSRRLALTERQRFDWLRLFRTESIGPRTFRALINQHGSAGAVLEALPDLARRAGRLVVPAGEADIEAELRALHHAGGRIVALGEPGYPALLERIDSAPPILSVLGQDAALAAPSIAIVGARNASALGQRLARHLAQGLAEAGLTVVSGLARGIDTAAHEAALAGSTVAVLAGGLGRLYPRENEALAARIAERGALVSEMPYGWTATGRDFPRRNRIVSGLSYGVVVVEAALRSGSLITARFANDQGREVFAIPGSPLDPRAEGTNRLIRDGAIFTTSVEDVLEALRPMIADGAPHGSPLREEGAVTTEPLWDEWETLAPPAPRASPEDHVGDLGDTERLIAMLGTAPVSVDELSRQSGLAVGRVLETLVELDLAGRIERHGSNRVSLV